MVPAGPVTSGQRLRHAPHLGLASRTKRVDRRRTEAVVRIEQPADRFLVAETCVTQHDEGPPQLAERFAVLQEVCRNLEHSVDACRRQVSVLDEPPNAAHAEAEQID